MPRCHFHPGTQTNVSCPECERFMCPKDMVPTSVGYKCRACASHRPYVGARGPLPYVTASAVALVGGAFGGLLLGRLFEVVRGPSVFLVLIFGILLGDLTRRAARGQRSNVFAALACAGALAGSVLGGFHSVETGFAAGAAVLYLLYGV